MIGTLTHRIHMICGDELSELRRQMDALGRLDIHEGGVEGAATAMARKPSCVNHGVSVDVVCFAQRSTTDVASIMISVAMHVSAVRQRTAQPWMPEVWPKRILAAPSQ
ncbi:hypothetical protein [Arthrobacter sp. HMWF013]|uniref:hypothetical protein n=1 Tax=Arthrobacter sp. HMWF013 TaxID=2056849 RepID=UPI000D39019B|nr:hypothetical protein [Arthrobacter sp. HMWF013]PTT58788.1 hypothetical protein DBR22_22790 [Arthrobacter sp. HMWF013]